MGGTLTILCYGYWIREKGRTGIGMLRICRIDLTVGYGVTVLFGAAMVIIGSTIEVRGEGADLLVAIANRLESSLGGVGRWPFLVGAFSAVFSSLIGVWQAVPYLFADLWRLFFRQGGDIPVEALSRSAPHRAFLVALSTLPAAGLLMSFKEVQKLYAVVGSLFIPLLATALLVMNGRRAWVDKHTNGPVAALTLAAALLFFTVMAWLKWAA